MNMHFLLCTLSVFFSLLASCAKAPVVDPENTDPVTPPDPPIEVITYPDYSDLNDNYVVDVKMPDGYRNIRVYDALCSDYKKHRDLWNDWGNDKKLRDEMSYAIFEDDFAGPVTIRVKKLKGKFTYAEVRPSTYNIKVNKIDSKTIEFTIPSLKQSKVSVEFNGDRYHNLFLYGYQPDQNKPNKSNRKVKYYEAGEHILPDAGLTLQTGETLYLEYGAVLYGKLTVAGNNVTIAGHGVLSGAKMRHWGDSQYSCGDILITCNPNLSGLEMRDITIIDSPSWTIQLTNHSVASFDGINMICWELNGDGIDVLSCRDVEIKNCFLRCYDDCITLKVRKFAQTPSDCHLIRISNNLIYSDYARGIVVGPEAGNTAYKTGRLHDIEVSDCIILNHAGGKDQSDIRAGVAIGQYCHYGWEGGTAAPISDVTFRNITFDSVSPGGQNISIIQEASQEGICTMENITFENIRILDSNNAGTPAFYVNSGKHSINSLYIKNCTYNDSPIKSEGEQFTVYGSGQKNIYFQ